MLFALLAANPRLIELSRVDALPAPHPYAISSNGLTVVGGFAPAEGFVYRLGGGISRFRPGGRAVYPNAVANDGTIVGIESNAFLYRQGRYTELAPLNGDSNSVASGISPDGTVAVGYSQSPAGVYHAMVWKRTRGEILPAVEGYAGMHARAVATAGAAVVGVAYRPDQSLRAFLWTAKRGSALLKLPTWGAESAAEAITPDGRLAVGYVSGAGKTRAIIWNTSGGHHILPSLGNTPGTSSAARCIESKARWFGGYDGERAVIWGPDRQPRDLTRFLGKAAAGWQLESVNGIARRGSQIVLCGFGQHRGKGSGFVATFQE